MGNDTLRVGDRTVALAEIEAYCREGVHIAPSNILVLLAEIRRLRAVEELLRRAWPYVASHNDSEHMLDGFAGRVARSSDGLLREIADALAAAPPETGETTDASE